MAEAITIGIASGRPGSGRRTIGVNLAATLAAGGRRIGLTDTETRGPIVPETLGAAEPEWREGRLIPSQRQGIQLMSFSCLIQPEERMDGRTPLTADLAARFVELVAWDRLDMLFVEIPSARDATLSLMERVRLDGVVMVATPRAAAEGATEAALAFYDEMGAALLGMIENLSYHQCRQCGRRDAAEASGSVASLAQRMGIRYLGEVPISITLRDCMDANCPSAAFARARPEADVFGEVARNLLAALDGRAPAMTGTTRG